MTTNEDYAHAFDDVLAIVFSRDGSYSDFRIPIRPRRKGKDKGLKEKIPAADAGKVINHNGHRYAIDLSSAFSLETWYPWTRYHWFYGIFTDRLVPRIFRIGVLFYREPTDALHGVEVPVRPLDRLTDLMQYIDDNEQSHKMPDWAILLNPSTVTTFAYSKVFKKAIKRNPFGLGTTARVWLIIVAVMVLLMFLLYQGGYFG